MKIKGIELLKNIDESLSITSFTVFEELLYKYEDNILTLYMCISTNYINKNNYRIKLKFSGLRQLKLNNFGCIEKNVFGFKIENISNRGWENINWEINDTEDNEIYAISNDLEIINILKL